MLHLKEVIEAFENANLAVSEHFLDVVLVFLAVGAAGECATALHALVPRIFNDFHRVLSSGLDVGDKLHEDLMPQLFKNCLGLLLDFKRAAFCLIAELG